MAFQPVDYYNIYEQLTSEEKLVRESVADFVDNEVLPVIEHHYQAGTFPMDLVGKMAELGLFGITLPQEYGCAGANYVSYGLAMQELERGDSGYVPLLLSKVHLSCSQFIHMVLKRFAKSGFRDWPQVLQ